MQSSVATEVDNKALTELCAEWQKRLRLTDWRVSIKYTRASEGLGENEGRCTWNLHRKEACIEVLDPVDHPTNKAFPCDTEVTVVHELVHLHFAPFDAEEESAESVAQEQAIECIAQALVEAERGEGG